MYERNVISFAHMHTIYAFKFLDLKRKQEQEEVTKSN